MDEPRADTPLVSCILSTFRHAPFVEQALDSIREQTYPAIQLVVVDDASDDGTVDVVRRWQDRHGTIDVLLAGRRNRGATRRFNEAMDVAVGEYVTIMSGDDWMERDRFARQVPRLLSAGDDVAVVYSDAQRVGTDGTPVEGHTWLTAIRGTADDPPEGAVHLDLVAGCFIPAHGALTRRRVLDEVGAYDESYLFEDWATWLAIAEAGYRFLYEPGLLVNYRIHDGSLSSTRWATNLTEIVRVLDLQRSSPEARAVAAERMSRVARRLYASGLDPRAGRSALRRAFRAQPSLENGLVLAAAEARLPYAPLRRLRDRVEKRGRAVAR